MPSVGDRDSWGPPDLSALPRPPFALARPVPVAPRSGIGLWALIAVAGMAGGVLRSGTAARSRTARNDSRDNAMAVPPGAQCGSPHTRVVGERAGLVQRHL